MRKQAQKGVNKTNKYGKIIPSAEKSQRVPILTRIRNRLSSRRVEKSKGFVETDEFLKISRGENNNYFTRNRKLSLILLVYSMLIRRGNTLKMELYRLKEHFNMQSKISVSGYHQQRVKLNPKAIECLAQHYVRLFYEDGEAVKTIKGYLLLATDGTSVNVSPTEENIKKYCEKKAENTKDGVRIQPQMGVSTLFDVKNRMIIDMLMFPEKFCERSAAKQHIDNAPNIIGNRRYIVAADRGYPAGDLFLDFLNKGIKFIVRLSKTDYKKEQLSMESDDCNVTIVFNNQRLASKEKEVAEKLKAAGSIELRFVRIKLSSDETEYIATNLDYSEFNTKEIGELYHLRWGIETVYDDLKNKLKMECFSGTKPVIMEQDLYATMYLSNLINDLAQEAAAILEEEDLKGYKYEMQININMAIGIVKENLVKMCLAKDRKTIDELMDSIVDDILENLLPIRKGRSFPRNTNSRKAKYFNNRKPAY